MFHASLTGNQFIYSAGLLLLSLLILTGCSIEKPEAPTWDAQYSVPLISKHYDMEELVERMAEDALSYDSINGLSLSFDQSLDTVEIDAGLSASGVSESFDHQLGNVAIDAPETQAVEIELADHITLAASVPETGFNADKDFQAYDEFQSATFSEGYFIMNVTNDFGIAIDSLTVYLVDKTDSDTLATFDFPGVLENAESVSDSIALSGLSVSSQLELKSRIHIPGGTLLQTGENKLSLELSYSDQVSVSSATTRVPNQQKDYSGGFSLSENHRLTEALIESGDLTITVSNTSELSADLTVTIDEIKNGTQPLTLDVSVPAGGNQEIVRDIAGYTVVPEIVANKMNIEVDMSADINGSGSNYVQIGASDKFALSASLGNLEFSQVTGVVSPTMIEMSEVVEELELPDGMENISLTDAVLEITLYSEVSIPAEVDVTLTGDAGQNLNIVGNLNGGSPQNPGVTQITISDLSTLTDPVPETITISGIATAGDGSTSGSVYSGSRIWGTADINSPLKFRIGQTEFEGDINSTEIDQDDIDEVSDRLNSGIMYATLTNHLPFGCTVELYFSGDSTTLYESPELLIGPESVSAGQVGADGRVSSATLSNLVINLSDSDLDIIENETLFIGQKLTLPGTNGQAVEIINTDYLEIEAYITLNTRMGD